MRSATSSEYQAAISEVLREGVPAKHEALLRAHLRASCHSASAEELALAVGYRNFQSVNLQYGTLARRVASHLGITQEPEVGFWLWVLVKWAKSRSPAGHTRFVLRSEVVSALRALGFS